MKRGRGGAFVRFVEGPTPARGGPLGGLKFAVKDNIDLKGVETGNGNPQYADWRGLPERDADVVVALEAAGAQCVAKAHMHELAYGLTGVNRALGTPLNPFRQGRIPGGSSSGSAVAVAASLVDFSVGTDTGGSVRVPAAFCGVYGFRPSHGAVSLGGVVSLAESFDTVGLFARDAATLNRVAVTVLASEPEGGQTSPGKVIVFDDLDHVANDAAISKVIETAEKLERLGYVVESTSGSRCLADARAAQTVLQGVEAYAYHRHWLAAKEPKLGSDVERLLEAASTRTDAEVEEAAHIRRAVVDYAHGLVSDSDLLLLPVGPGDPPFAEELDDPETAMAFRSSILNLSNFASLIGFPVVSVPTPGPAGEGLGVQVIARFGRDRWLLSEVGRLAAIG